MGMMPEVLHAACCQMALLLFGVSIQHVNNMNRLAMQKHKLHLARLNEAGKRTSKTRDPSYPARLATQA